MVVVLLHDQLGGKDVIHPVGHAARLVVGALAGDGVDQHRADDVPPAEQADGVAHTGADPPRIAVLINFKGGIVEHEGGIAEPQMAVEIAAEVLGGGVADALVQPYYLHVLRDHVDDEVGRQTLRPVVQPLDEVAVPQGRHPDGAALIVDLGVVVRHLKLGHHVRQLAQLAVAQLHGGLRVQHGDLVIADLLHLGGEVAVLHGQQIAVVLGAEQLPAQHRAYQRGGRQSHRQEQGHGTLLFQKAEIALGAAALKAGGQHGAHAVHRADQQREGVELLTFEVDGRQHHIVVDGGENQRHRQIQQCAAQRRAHGLALLLGAVLTAEALKIGIVPVCIHRQFLSLLFCGLRIVYPTKKDLYRVHSPRPARSFYASGGKGYFALQSDPLLPTAAKVGKNAVQTCGLKIRPRPAHCASLFCVPRAHGKV